MANLTAKQVSAYDLLKQAKDLRDENPKASLSLAQEVFDLAHQVQDQELWYQSSKELAEVMLLLGHYHEAFHFIYQAIEYRPSERLHQCLAMAYAELGDTAKALEHFLLARDLLKETKNAEAYISCLNNLAIVYQMQGDHERELRMLQEALEHLDSENKYGLSLLHNNIAVAYVAQEVFDLALKHSLKALEIAKETKKHALICTTTATLAEVYLRNPELTHLPKAITHLELALSMTAELGLKNDEVLVTRFMGEAYFALDETEKAIHYLEHSIELGKAIDRKYELSKSYLSLVKVYKQTGAFEKTLVCFEEHHKLNNELFNAEADRNLRNIQVLHDTQAALERADAEKERADELEKRVKERTEELEQAHVVALERLSMVVRHRDGETAEHTKRVGQLAAKIAGKLGCDDGFVQSLELAARLHDLGKVGVPDRILLKPGKLTEEEFAIIKRHTVMGAGMLAAGQSPLMKMAQQVALSHHERWDGSGYPKGLVAETIPLVGRIVAVVDTYDALIHERPYKKAWSQKDAVAEIKAQSGKMFDPEVVQVFLSIDLNSFT